MKKTCALLILFSLLPLSIIAQAYDYPQAPYQIQLLQSNSLDDLPKGEPIPYSDDEFPLWLRDIRRAEVIFFGSLPLTFILTGFVYTAVKYGSASLNIQQADYVNFIAISSLVSAGVTILDYVLINIKRHNEREQAQKLSPKELPPPGNTPPEDTPPENDPAPSADAEL